MKLFNQISGFKQWMLDNLERDEIEDIYNHGANNGAPGLTYYSETCALYKEHAEEIWDALDQDAEDMGYKNTMELISTFGGIRDVGSTRPDNEQFQNLLVWYLAERTAREIVENREFLEETEELEHAESN